MPQDIFLLDKLSCRNILDGNFDVVFGSRMIDKKSALKGGMPKYKWVGNQILKTFQD